MAEGRFPLLRYNQRVMEWRAVWISDRVDHLPTWVADVNGEVGNADTLEGALLHAARRADVMARANDLKADE